MSTRITHQADGTARGQTQQNTANSIIDLRKQPASPPSRTAAASRRCPPARKTRGNTWPGAAPA